MDFRLFVSSSSSVVKMTFSSDHLKRKEWKNEWMMALLHTYNLLFEKTTKQINKQTMVWNISKVYHKKIIIIMMMIHSLSLLKKIHLQNSWQTHTHREHYHHEITNWYHWGLWMCEAGKIDFYLNTESGSVFFPSFSSHSMMMMIIVINIQPAKTILINNQSI